ncbi:MAG TPA: hypothetical protein DIU20_14850, partial [Cryomorphaceae bacterium]|nr:hypothetical protein [Cryomorphaceae bacterium]
MIHKLLTRGKNRFSLPFFLFISTVFLVFTGCIPTKKIVYVEAEEGGKTEHQVQSWEYHIKTGDRFYIKVTDPETSISFSQSTAGIAAQGDKTNNLVQQGPSVHDYLVTEDGQIDYPVLGKIPAEGKTIQELITFIEEKSKGYYSNPSVKVFMTNYNVTVLGEVNNPGTYQLITNHPTFFDAVGQARDLTDYANRSSVKIIRKRGNE